MMKSSKSEQCKEKSKSKTACSSKQASKYLEKEGFNGLSLNYKGVAANLVDFIPDKNLNVQEGLELDFEVSKLMKKLEKKDAGTKQKALTDLIESINEMEVEVVKNILRYWPKIYNRLSLDEDKRVRELTQQMMSSLAGICGKNLALYIKQLLPTWIFAQSDIHGPAANIAITSFNSVFEEEDRRKKAYLLCWTDISGAINNILVKGNDIEKEEMKHLTKEKKQTSLKKEIKEKKNKSNILEDQSFCMKSEEVNLLYRDEKQSPKIISANEEILPFIKKEEDTDTIVLHMRTLVTLLPYIAKDKTGIEDLSKWLHSKSFWAHFKLATCNNIISIYLTFSTDLLTYVPELVLGVPFVISNIIYSFRLIDKYHVSIVPLVWTLIIKSIDTLGDCLWQLVSFQNTFLPRWLKFLECGVDGNISIAGSFMLPFFTHLPIDLSSKDSLLIFGRIFDSMSKGLICSRVRNISNEANCFTTTILECATYTILKANSVSNDVLKDKVLFIIWNILESYMTISDFNKAHKSVYYFCQVALRPLLNKGIVNSFDLTSVLSSWIDKYHNRACFNEHLTELIIELGNLSISDVTFYQTITDTLQVPLIENVLNTEDCLLPYLIIISSHNVALSDDDLQLKYVFKQCKDIIREYNSSLMTNIALGMANILNYIPSVAPELYEDFLASLSFETLKLFFNKYYDNFLCKVDGFVGSLLAKKTLDVWIKLLSEQFEICLEDSKEDFACLLQFIFHHCKKSYIHCDHLPFILRALDSKITLYIDASVSYDCNEVIIGIVKHCIEEIQLNFSIDILPQSLVFNFVKILIYTAHNPGTKADLSHLRLYIQQATRLDICLTILDIVLLNELGYHQTIGDILQILFKVTPHDFQRELLYHIDQMLLKDISSIEKIIQYQKRYSLSVLPNQQQFLTVIIHKVEALIHFQYDIEPSFNQLKTTVTHCCVLLTPILFSTFANCFHSSHILLQCESIYTYIQGLTSESLKHAIDLMLISSKFDDNEICIFDNCPNLVVIALKHFISSNYSQWSDTLLSSVDFAIQSWTNSDLNERQLALMFQVLFPCALKARYIVQEILLASISTFLSKEANPYLANINRIMLLIKSLTETDPSFFQACYPLLMSVKPKFELHMDQLYDSIIDMSDYDETHFNLSSLLEFLISAVDSSFVLDNSQWDFILCLISTLSRSSQFINSGDFAFKSVSKGIDHLFNSYLLLRLISLASISLASINNESILDEWDNLFSEPIFTTILDLFSFISGDHSQGKLVSSDIFIFYTEALAEAVSLCPVSIILGHNFNAQIHINDPIELPKDFLLAFNSLLESLSSYSLSTQLAAYNCLLNLADNFSHLICEQITKVEDDDSLESFCLTIPYKLLSYLQCDGLLQLSIDKIENEIVLTRCFLAWNIVLQLFSCSQPKVRAELSTFLINHNRCFDNFLSFCFAFMPKNPLINKKNLTFLQSNGKQSCNLIAEEPQIFSNCFEHRTKFIIYHLSSYMFRRSLQVLPNLTRCWFMSLDVCSQQQVDLYVRQHITPELLKIEFEQLKRSIMNNFEDKLEIQTFPVIGEVTIRYVVSDDQCLEQVISLPNNYPIGKTVVDFKKELKVKLSHWKSWIIQMTSTMENQNGSILDGVKLWKKNLDNHFAGAEDCMICYSILHAIKYTLPSMKCKQCKKKFHKECMYKWFQSSTNATCPNCRNVFNDGTYRRVQYGGYDT